MNGPQGYRDTGQLSPRQAELVRLSRDELVDLVLRLEGHLSAGTQPFKQPEVIRSFDLDLAWQPREYLRLPKLSIDRQLQTPWRVMLVSFDLAHPIIGLEVYGDVVVGRSTSDSEPDLDLTDWEPHDYGVSRRHAMLHPTHDELQLVDLESTNGTRKKGKRLLPLESQVLANNDVIAIGALQFQIRIVEEPG